MLHGKFEKKSFENLDGLASDLGPILISHGVSNRSQIIFNELKLNTGQSQKWQRLYDNLKAQYAIDSDRIDSS